MKTYICKYCKKEFKDFRSAYRLFCSKSCSAFSRKELYRTICKKIGKLSKSKEHRKKISQSQMGKINWNAIEAMKKANKHRIHRKGWKHTKEALKKISNTSKRLWKTQDLYRKKVLGKRPMSSLEIKVNKVIEKYSLPYKFVGNGDFSIERKVPDFININGEKKAIEVFWQRHKNQFKEGGLEGWKEERLKIFNKYGWEVIFIEGTNLTENKILETLKGGY